MRSPPSSPSPAFGALGRALADLVLPAECAVCAAPGHRLAGTRPEAGRLADEVVIMREPGSGTASRSRSQAMDNLARLKPALCSL